MNFILTNSHNISFRISHYYFQFCRGNGIWEVTCPGSQVVSKRKQTQHQLYLTSKSMFLTMPQNQNGKVSWRHGELNLRLVLPASCSGDLGALISSFCVSAGRLFLPCLHKFQMASDSQAIQASRRKLQASLLSPFQVIGQGSLLGKEWDALAISKSWRLKVLVVFWATTWLWNRKVAGSRVNICMWSVEFAVTAPDRVLGSLLWPWLGAPELDPSLLGTTFHSPRGASSIQDCSHYP